MKIRINVRHVYWNLVYSIILISGFGLGSVLWGAFEIPFKNKSQVMGPLVLEKYNPQNGIAYFLIFVTLPSFLFSIVYFVNLLRKTKTIQLKTNKNIFFSIPRWLKLDECNRYLYAKLKWLNVLNGIIMFLFAFSGLLYWLSMSYPSFPLDIFHEGESLSPAFKYLKTGELWKGSFFIHGVLYDPGLSLIGWEMFNQVSIGAYRLVALFMANIVVIPLAFLFYVTANSIDGRSSSVRKILLMQIFVAIYYFTEPLKGTLPLQYLEKRDLFVLVGLIFLVQGVRVKRPHFFYFTGLFSALCYVYAIDRGAYFTMLLIVVSGAMLVFPLSPTKKINYKLFLGLIGGIISGWLLFVFFFGIEETVHFLSDTLVIYQIKDLFDSYRLPNTFLYKIPMMAIGLQLFLFVVYFWKYYLTKKIGRVQFYIHFIFTFMSLVYFRSAFGRGDLTHLMYASSFAYFGLGIIMWNFCRRLDYRWILLVSSFLIVLNLNATRVRYKSYKLSKIVSIKKRTSEYAAYPDDKFLTVDLQKSIRGLKALYKNQPGVMSFSSDAGLAYLLRKPHYGKNYIVWFASSIEKRQELKEDFDKYKPEFLILKGFAHCYDKICNDIRFPELDKWIHKKYKPYKIFPPWEVFKRR